LSRGDGRVFRRKGSARWWIQYSVRGQQFREPAGKTQADAKKRLKQRQREAFGERFAGPDVERVTVAQLADALVIHQTNKGRASAKKTASHLKPVRARFGLWRAMDVTTTSVERYQRDRLDAGKARATVNREIEALRRAYNVAARQTPPTFPKHLVPHFPTLSLDNVRVGFFDRADVQALLKQVEDAGIRDMIEWAFRTGMRKGEITKLTWDMLDRTGTPWVLHLSAALEKNRTRRLLGIEGDVRTIMERRLAARRLNCPLIFHRASKGKSGQPITDFWPIWKAALKAARLPAGRLFHDLRRSAVRTLLRAGVDESTAMKVSGHKTRSMLLRYNIVTEEETAAAFVRADLYLSTQPSVRNLEEGQFGDSGAEKSGKPLSRHGGIGSSGRIRTYDPPVNSRMLYR
jgi:integrase